MTATVTIEISPGELFDKITILEIKTERIEDNAKLTNIRYELGLLRQARGKLPTSQSLSDLIAKLKTVNERLWDIEDAIRDREREGDFGERFIELARSVYQQNDQRAQIKRALNESLGSKLVEEKSYVKYKL